MVSAQGWEELLRTAETVRRQSSSDAAMPRRRRRRGILLGTLVAAAGLLLLHPGGTPVRADAGLDSDLFALTNQDRASNGVGALGHNSTLQYIGENAPAAPCGGSIAGRSEDMINRNYFAHPIPPCGKYVFVVMQAYGVNYRSAGENIGWESGAGDAAGYINGQFMASPEHRSNILNGNYTDLGIGSWTSGAGAWSGGGGAYTHVWMFSEEFAQLGPPPPQPQPTASGTPPRNSPAPPTPQVPPISVAPATPTAPAPPSSHPAPTVPPRPQVPGLPLLYTSQGVISDAVLSVLEGYLLD